MTDEAPSRKASALLVIGVFLLGIPTASSGLVPVVDVAEGECVDSDYTNGFGGQHVECVWECKGPGTIQVTADATDNDAGVSGDGDCAGANVHCSGNGGCTSEPEAISSDGVGTCSADSQEAIDSGLYVSCTSSPTEVEPPIDDRYCPISVQPSPPYPSVCIDRPDPAPECPLSSGYLFNSDIVSLDRERCGIVVDLNSLEPINPDPWINYACGTVNKVIGGSSTQAQTCVDPGGVDPNPWINYACNTVNNLIGGDTKLRTCVDVDEVDPNPWINYACGTVNDILSGGSTTKAQTCINPGEVQITRVLQQVRDIIDYIDSPFDCGSLSTSFATTVGEVTPETLMAVQASTADPSSTLCNLLERGMQNTAQDGTSAHIFAVSGIAFGLVCTGYDCQQTAPECVTSDSTDSTRCTVGHV